MEAIFSTSGELIKALASTLVHSLWIGAAIWLGLRFILSGIHHRHSYLRYILSTASLFLQVLLAPVLLSIIYRPETASNFLVKTASSLLLAFTQTSVEQSIVNTSWQELIILIYVIGILFFTFRLLYSSIRALVWINLGKELSEQRELLNVLQGRLSISRRVRIISSEKVSSPSLYGFFRPVILVPIGMFTHMPIEQVEAILIHELVHIKRFDFAVNMIQHFCEIFFFFNPFVWMVSSEIRREREKYCDDYVLRHTQHPDIYAKALFNLTMLEKTLGTFVIPADGGSGKQLLFRIKRILKTDTMKRKINSRALLSMIVVLGIGTVIVLSGFCRTSTFDYKQETSTLPEIIQSSSILPSMRIEKNKLSMAAPDTIKKEKRRVIIIDSDNSELSDEERAELIQHLERTKKELEEIDWEVEMQEFEVQRQEALEDLHEEMAKVHEHMSEIHEDEIHFHFEQARQDMDSVIEHADFQDIQFEIQSVIAEMEVQFRDGIFENEELKEALRLEIEALKGLDIEAMRVDIENAAKELERDFDFDMDISFDMDSLMDVAHIQIESIDIEAIREDMEEAVKELELKIQELKEKEVKENGKK